MKRTEMEALFQQGFGMDAVYEIAAGKLGLFCVAFFGHKGQRGDKAKLQRVWNRIVDQYHKHI